MKVYLYKDVPKVGFEGEIVKVNEGYARNFLIPRKLGVEVTAKNKSLYESKIKAVEHRKEAIATETSMFAEKINNMTITLKRKMHDDGKLYGAISPLEIVESLQSEGIAISKGQVKIAKSIKSKGNHKVTIKLTSRLQPQLIVNVISE